MTSYKGANLRGRDFSNTNLPKADFRGANVQEAVFVGAVLAGAQFRGADVLGANFTDAALTDAGLVGVRNAGQAIWPTDFPLAARRFPPPHPPRTEQERLLAYYFDANGHLTEIPVGQTRQRVVMDRIVEASEPDARYPEKVLNEKLKPFHPDFATLHRYLIDHHLRARENNVYWCV